MRVTELTEGMHFHIIPDPENQTFVVKEVKEVDFDKTLNTNVYKLFYMKLGQQRVRQLVLTDAPNCFLKAQKKY